MPLQSAVTTAVTLESAATTTGASHQQLPGRVTAWASRVQAKAALATIGVGFIVMALGAAGAATVTVAGQVVLEAQFPYLLSGSLIGLALVVFGSALLVVNGHNLATAELGRIIALTAQPHAAGVPAGPSVESPAPVSVPVPAPVAVPAGSRRRAPAPAPAPAPDVRVAGASSSHLPTCRLVAGRNDLPLIDVAGAAARGLAPCRICQPALST